MVYIAPPCSYVHTDGKEQGIPKGRTYGAIDQRAWEGKLGDAGNEGDHGASAGKESIGNDDQAMILVEPALDLGDQVPGDEGHQRRIGDGIPITSTQTVGRRKPEDGPGCCGDQGWYEAHYTHTYDGADEDQQDIAWGGWEEVFNVGDAKRQGQDPGRRQPLKKRH